MASCGQLRSLFNHSSQIEHKDKRKRGREGDWSSSEPYFIVLLLFCSIYENFTRTLPIFERMLRLWTTQHSYDLLDSKPTRERHCGVYLQWNPDWSALVIAPWLQEHLRSSHLTVPILRIQIRRLVFVRIFPFNCRSFCNDEGFAGLELLRPIWPDAIKLVDRFAPSTFCSERSMRMRKHQRIISQCLKTILGVHLNGRKIGNYDQL